jgi:uncharacterized membrane protein HdeD (DUF308 family)
MIRLDVDPQTRQELLTSSTWSITVGIILIVLGIGAIALPLLSTLAATLIFGGLLAAWGVFQIIFAFQTRKTGAFALKLITGILVLLGGLFVLFFPVPGVLTLTLVLGITIFVKGVLQVIYAFQMRPSASWGWMLFSGIVGIILGILIWSQWPYSAMWLIGLWIGIKFLIDGLAIIFLSLSMRHALKQSDQPMA